MRASPVVKPLAVSLCTALGLAAVPSALAQQFNVGEWTGTFNTTLSVGASWRTEDPSKDAVSPGNTNGKGRASASVTDDGNLNYEQWDVYSLLFKGVTDFEFTNGQYGLFSRIKYWYDYELAEGNVPHGHAATNYVADEELDVSDFEDLAQDKGIEFLDYYVYGSFDVADKPLELRAGNMVLSWGESTFIQNGVNIINPFDVTALRSPGAEIKEALLPVGMVYGNFGVTPDLSVEAYYQYEWQRFILDECGTYWNSGDPYGGGCNYLTASASPSDREQFESGNIIERAPDDEASDSGQWGISARYFVESLNATEFGAYYVNYHSKTPIFSAINATENFGSPFIFGANPKYFFEFPEDIEVYGLTFATNVGNWAWSGELSYRPDFPLQINQTNILQAAGLADFDEWTSVGGRVDAAGEGGRVRGYDDVEYTQFQMTFINFFDQVWGADRLSLAAEIGATWLGGMDDDQVYGRSSTYGVNKFAPVQSEIFFDGNGDPVTITCDSHPGLEPLFRPNTNSSNCTNDGFTDDFSWGYRVRGGLEYSDVFAGVNLTPNMAWSHDVHGNSPPPNFIEDRMALAVGVTADYLAMYEVDLSYTTFFGDADYNDQEDRDFISLSFSVAF